MSPLIQQGKRKDEEKRRRGEGEKNLLTFYLLPSAFCLLLLI
jgi:hypothetical protein